MRAKSKAGWYIGLSLALAVGALTVPVLPAYAQAPNLGSDWVLTETKRIRKWVPNPPKPGRGKWKLKAVKDRKYFVADNEVGKNTERVLDNSKLQKEETEKTPEEKFTEKVPGKPTVKEKTREVEGGKATAKKIEGRFVNTYHNWTVDKFKDTETTVPYDEYENVSWKERKKRYLKNQYRIKSELTFEDPKTRGRIKAKSESLEAPVDEIDFTAWQDKKDRRFKGKGADVSSATEKIGSRNETKRIAQATTVDFGTGGPSAIAPDSNVARSGETSAGASSARIVSANKARELSGAKKVESKGRGSLDLGPLLLAAKAGANLVDDRGGKWTLSSDGTSMFFTPAGGQAIRLEAGKFVGAGQNGKVKIDAAQVDGNRIVLQGEFVFKNKGDERESRILRTQ